MENKLSKFWAYVAVLVGILLVLFGLAAVIGYLGLPIFLPVDDVLTYNLGQMAAIFLGLFGGSLAVFHGLASIRDHHSSPMKLPSYYIFWIALALVLGLGSLVHNFEIAREYLFPPLFMLGAALSTFAVLAWSFRRMGEPVTWRQVALAFVCGSTLSIVVAILLETVLPYLGYLLLEPAWYLAEGISDFGWGAPGLIERVFSSPLILVILAVTALEAPIPEEFAKALSIPLFGRARITNERQAFAIGLASGAGFAILENMLYEGLYANYNGWGWAGITLLRSIGSVLHPLGTGIIALGWFRMRGSGAGKLFKAYLLSVGLHTLWNGGFEPLLYLTGLDYFAGNGSSLTLYGETLSVLLVGYLFLLSVGLWWLLRRIVNQISERIIPNLMPATVSRGAVATWAVACALVIVPIGATLSPAWTAVSFLLARGEITPVLLPEIGTAEEAHKAFNINIPDLDLLARRQPDIPVIQQPGDVYRYEIALEKSRQAIWSYVWCATTQSLLDDNFKNSNLEFFAGGTLVPVDRFYIHDYRTVGFSCREYIAVINSWPRGRFQLETRLTFRIPVYDGTNVYPAGTHSYIYIVTVKH